MKLCTTFHCTTNSNELTGWFYQAKYMYINRYGDLKYGVAAWEFSLKSAIYIINRTNEEMTEEILEKLRNENL